MTLLILLQIGDRLGLHGLTAEPSNQYLVSSILHPVIGQCVSCRLRTTGIFKRLLSVFALLCALTCVHPFLSHMAHIMK